MEQQFVAYFIEALVSPAWQVHMPGGSIKKFHFTFPEDRASGFPAFRETGNPGAVIIQE